MTEPVGNREVFRNMGLPGIEWVILRGHSGGTGRGY
jgi:hypothetical protein